MKSYFLFLSLSLGLLSITACKNEGKENSADQSSEWKEVSYANALEAAHSVENREGWVTNQLAPSATDIHAAVNMKDSVAIMQYHIVQQSEIETLANYLNESKVDGTELIKRMKENKPAYAWWPIDEIAEQIQSGKLLVARFLNGTTNEMTFHVLNTGDGQYYYLSDVFNLKSADKVNNNMPDSTGAPAADTTQSGTPK